jgi:hypothetical protein
MLRQQRVSDQLGHIHRTTTDKQLGIAAQRILLSRRTVQTLRWAVDPDAVWYTWPQGGLLSWYGAVVKSVCYYVLTSIALLSIHEQLGKQQHAKQRYLSHRVVCTTLQYIASSTYGVVPLDIWQWQSTKPCCGFYRVAELKGWHLLTRDRRTPSSSNNVR